MPIKERFWSKVDKSGDCWLWMACVSGSGYPAFWYKGKYWGAHRMSLILDGQDIPSGLNVCHKCDTPTCVNPEHLFIGTQSDNIKDMVAKGRRTEFGKGSKFSLAQVEAMREDPRTQAAIAAEYGVGQSHISRLISGERGARCL